MKSNNNNPLVSIIVPVYGEDGYFPSCLESICNQTYTNLEIILVDDGSPDRCPDICDAYASKDKRIKVIHKINAGLVEARKTGIRLSTGYYVAYVDGDDEIENDYIEKLVSIAIKGEVDVVADGFCKLTNGKISKHFNNIPTGKYNKKPLEDNIYSQLISCNDFYSFGIFTYVWGKLFKRSVLFSNQLSVPSQLIVGEDSSCVYPTILESNSIYVTDICGYHYRQRTGSLLRLRKNDSSMVGRLVACYNYLYNRFCELNKKDVMEQQLVRYITSQLIMLSDCLVQLDNNLPASFPFMDIKQEDKVIIYSAGAFGKHLYLQFCEHKCCEVVVLCDPDSDCLDDVLSLEEAIQKQFDKIVVASVDRLFINQAIRDIKSYGVPLDKIVTIDNSGDYIYDYCKNIVVR